MVMIARGGGDVEYPSLSKCESFFMFGPYIWSSIDHVYDYYRLYFKLLMGEKISLCYDLFVVGLSVYIFSLFFCFICYLSICSMLFGSLK